MSGAGTDTAAHPTHGMAVLKGLKAVQLVQPVQPVQPVQTRATRADPCRPVQTRAARATRARPVQPVQDLCVPRQLAQICPPGTTKTVSLTLSAMWTCHLQSSTVHNLEEF